MTLIEILVVCAWLAVGIGTATSLGTRFGVAGAGIGLVVGLLVPVGVLVAFERIDRRRFPELPKCRSGACDGPKAYGWVERRKDGWVLSCGCGDRYLLSPRKLIGSRYFQVLSVDGRPSAFLRQRPFRAWEPDSGPP